MTITVGMIDGDGNEDCRDDKEVEVNRACRLG